MSGPIRFGGFELDKERFQLTRNGLRIDLPRIAMEVLFLLAERPGVLVSRAQLVEAIWPGMHPDGKIQGVNTAINRIRGALRDDPAKPRFIETVIGKGYRFIAPVESEATPDVDGRALRSSANRKATPPALHRWSEAAGPGGGVGATAELPGEGAQFEVVSRGGTVRRTRAILVGAALLMVVAGVAMWRFVSSARSRSAAEFSLATPVSFTSNESDNVVRAAGISPDGMRVAFADSEGIKVSGEHDAAPVHLAAVSLPSVNRIAWLPNGKQLLVSGPGRRGGPEIWLLSAVSPAEPARLLRADAQFPSPSPDGSRIVYVSGSKHDLREVNPDGSGERLLLSGSAGEELAEPFWLPGGDLVMLQRRLKPTEGALLANPNAVGGPDQSTLLTVREKDGAILYTQNRVLMDNPCLYPDGSVLFIPSFGKAALAAARMDLRTGVLVSPPRAVELPAGLNSGGISVGPNGETALVLQSGRLGVSVARLGNSGRSLVGPHHLSSPLHAAFPHAWTPDSRAVFFEQEHEERWWLFAQDVEKRDAEPVDGQRLEGIALRVSPDHKWLLFYRPGGDSGALQLFRKPFRPLGAAVSGGGPSAAEPIAAPPGELRCPRTGTRCILRVKDAKRHEVLLYALDPATGATTKLQTLGWAESHFGDWDVSPDGESVVLCSGVNQPGELHMISLRTARESVLHFPVYAPFRSVNWQASGVGWFASITNGNVAVMYKLDSGGGAEALYSTEAPTWAVPSPDGRSIAYVELNRDRNVWITHPRTAGDR